MLRAVANSEKSGNRHTAVTATLIGIFAVAAVDGLFVAAGADKPAAVNGMLVGVDERATTGVVGADNVAVDGGEVAGGANGGAGSEASNIGGAGRSGQTSGHSTPLSMGPIVPTSNG